MGNYKETQERLKALKEQYGVEELYSWSKLDLFNTDKWVYYLKYVKKEKPDNRNGAYAVIGGVVHDLLQRFYEEDISNNYMVETLKEEYDDFVLKGYKFDKFDEQRNDKIAEKYIKSCEHFLERHQKFEGKNACETFIPVVIQDEDGNNVVIQTYIDFLNNNNGVLSIIDYKTSTLYSGKQKEENANQLKIYALAVHLMKGISLDKIKLYWNFLKYVDINCLQANGKWKVRHIDRSEIGESLKTSIAMWARKLGYEEDEILQLQNECILYNSIDVLPEKIREKYEINECLVEIEFEEKDIQLLKDYILKTVKEIVQLENMYALTEDEMLFWQIIEPKDIYRLQNLCDYSYNLHLPYKQYIENEKSKSYGNISGGVTNEEIEDLLG